MRAVYHPFAPSHVFGRLGPDLFMRRLVGAHVLGHIDTQAGHTNLQTQTVTLQKFGTSRDERVCLLGVPYLGNE